MGFPGAGMVCGFWGLNMVALSGVGGISIVSVGVFSNFGVFNLRVFNGGVFVCGNMTFIFVSQHL